MNSIDINTSQNVNLSFELASIGDRIIAFALDTLLKISYLVAVWMTLIKLMDIKRIVEGWDLWSIYAVIIIITLPANFYTLLFESMMEGQTPGKRLMKIRVVKTDGYQASFGDYLTRWFFRLIDILLGMGVIAILSIVINKDNKRLGDIAAGTAVITLKKRYNINHTILVRLADDYVPKFPQVTLLSDNDMRIIKENFLQAKLNLDYGIIRKLALKICETIGVKHDSTKLTDQQFVAIVIKDYNFYTGKEQ